MNNITGARPVMPTQKREQYQILGDGSCRHASQRSAPACPKVGTGILETVVLARRSLPPFPTRFLPLTG